MAKYARPRGGNVVVQTKFCGGSEGVTFAPVIVLPEADWREMVDEINALKRAADAGPGFPGKRIDALIAKVEADNA